MYAEELRIAEAKNSNKFIGKKMLVVNNSQ